LGISSGKDASLPGVARASASLGSTITAIAPAAHPAPAGSGLLCRPFRAGFWRRTAHEMGEYLGLSGVVSLTRPGWTLSAAGQSTGQPC